MTKTFKKSVAFLSAVAMVMAMLLYFPSGIFSNIDWGLKASAEGITLTEPSKDGDGVYQIGTKEELYWFAYYVNSGNTDADAKLMNDITVNSDLLSSLDYDTGGNVTNGTSFTSWTPIGNDLNPYTGTFDGQGHTISGLYHSSGSDYVGLFGYVGTNGSVSNVGVVDSYFKGSYNVGGVCGRNDGKITNCYNTGYVSGTGDMVGGVCGYNYASSSGTATIENCYNTGAVSGNFYVGGVCGWNYASNGIATIKTAITLAKSAEQTMGSAACADIILLMME